MSPVSRRWTVPKTDRCKQCRRSLPCDDYWVAQRPLTVVWFCRQRCRLRWIATRCGEEAA